MSVPISSIHRPDRLSPPLIDACMMGWVRGVVKPEGGLIAFEDDDTVPRFGQDDLSNLPGFGLLTKLDGSHGWPHVALERTGVPTLDLWEVVRPHVAWAYRDPDVAMHPEDHKELLLDGSECLPMPLKELFHLAGGLILGARHLLLPFSARRVPVIVEGGRHLYARCIREAARGLGMPVWAIENTWLPGFAVMSPSGIAVNSFGHEYSWMEDELLGLEDQAQLLAWVAQKIECDSGVQANRRRYPWLYKPDEPPRVVFDVEDLAYMYEGKNLSVLVLGQVPYDASVVADNPLGWTMEGLVRSAFVHFIDRVHFGVTVIYRPHPMEELSAVDDLTSTDRVKEYVRESLAIPAGKEARLLISHPGRISLRTQLEAHTGPVLTINSQAGLEASLLHPTATVGRAFYDAAGLTWSHASAICSTRTSEQYRTHVRPQNRWARYVSFLLRRCYADKEKLRTPYGFVEALSLRIQRKVQPWSKSFRPPWRSP